MRFGPITDGRISGNPLSIHLLQDPDMNMHMVRDLDFLLPLEQAMESARVLLERSFKISALSMCVASIWNGYTVHFDNVCVGLCFLWMAAELRVSKRDVGTEGKKTADSATCRLHGFGQALTVLTALWFPSLWRAPNMAHVVGMGIFQAGVCYRLWAIRSLGRI